MHAYIPLYGYSMQAIDQLRSRNECSTLWNAGICPRPASSNISCMHEYTVKCVCTYSVSRRTWLANILVYVQ